jgi:hypothetical protein
MSEKARAQKLAEGISPLDFMLNILRDPQKDEATRMEAAKAAAPYLHPRLTAVELSGETTIRNVIKREPMSDEQMAATHGVELPVSRPH